MEAVVVVEIDEEGEVVTVVVEGDMAAEDGEVAVVGMAVEGEEVVVMVVGEGAEMASMETLGAR